MMIIEFVLAFFEVITGMLGTMMDLTSEASPQRYVRHLRGSILWHTTKSMRLCCDADRLRPRYQPRFRSL